jgi:hypothetical protein
MELFYPVCSDREAGSCRQDRACQDRVNSVNRKACIRGRRCYRTADRHRRHAGRHRWSTRHRDLSRSPVLLRFDRARPAVWNRLEVFNQRRLGGRKNNLGYFPATLDITPDGAFLFVVNFNLHGDMVPSSVSVVSTQTMTEVARIPTCTMPHGSRLNSQGTKQYSACMMDDMLVEIDTRYVERLAHFVVTKNQEKGMLDHQSTPSWHSMCMGSWLEPPKPGDNSCSPTWAEPSADGSSFMWRVMLE